MSRLDCFLMWFPPCAMFVAVAWVTESAWRWQDTRIKKFFRDRFRRVIRDEHGNPVMYGDDDAR
jgi:hypothetical protein